MTVANITHPTYDAKLSDWEKYRLAYEGGREFIDEYLKKYSAREDPSEFGQRKEMTYCPAHAKAAINDIKNAIFQRTTDISRVGGSLSYLNAATGSDVRGVDLKGNTMNSYIGRMILPELLALGKVGVFIDKPNTEIITRADEMSTRPYIYLYKAEDIRSWSHNLDHQLVSLLLRDYTYELDEETQLPSDETERFRHLWLADGVVHAQFYSQDGTPQDEEQILELDEIPFVTFEITASLMTDVADYQIALLNIASSDVTYTMKANFPFYTEQYDPNLEMNHLLRGPSSTAGESAPGTSSEAATSKGKEVKVGATQGRRYPKGMERPDFINPSSEPLRASLEKQYSLQQEIRQLVNLAVTNQAPRNASAESKSYDERGLEAGLSYIGLELEYGERRVAEFWAMYENTEPTLVKYPEKYTLKSDKERYEEADKLEKSAQTIPSNTYRREIMKEAAETRIGTKVSAAVLDEIRREIDAAVVVVTDPDVLHQDLEDGLVSPETAAVARGYGPEEVAKAAAAHEARLARIAIAQASGGGVGQARGIKDAGDPKEGRTEKAESRDTTRDEVVRDKTRGQGDDGTATESS